MVWELLERKKLMILEIGINPLTITNPNQYMIINNFQERKIQIKKMIINSYNS